MTISRKILIALFCVPLFAIGQSATQAERERFEEIKARHDRGEAVSQEDRQFAMRYMAPQRGPNSERRRAISEQNKEWAKTHPPRESTGLVPLTDLGSATYQGEGGGLYPDGGNTPPPVHLAAGIQLAKGIQPLDADGRESVVGKIVMLSIGMSNTTMEFQMFEKIASQDKSLNQKLLIVDGAQGGQTARITGNPQANFWKVVADRLQKAGVTDRQVQAAWIKQANARPREPFPVEAKRLQADIVATLHNLHDKFPNLKIAYLSSRIYGGFATTPLNPEPHAYEGGFAMKWVIADQIAGKPELNFDPAKGAVRSPWIAWGPYLWADGVKGRKIDRLVWNKDDFVESDRTHPATSAREKVAKLLLGFLKNDPTAAPWFTGN